VTQLRPRYNSHDILVRRCSIQQLIGVFWILEHIFLSFQWSIQGYSFSYATRVLPLKGFDMLGLIGWRIITLCGSIGRRKWWSYLIVGRESSCSFKESNLTLLCVLEFLLISSKVSSRKKLWLIVCISTQCPHLLRGTHTMDELTGACSYQL
jgi:hypothetical protein